MSEFYIELFDSITKTARCATNLKVIYYEAAYNVKVFLWPTPKDRCRIPNKSKKEMSFSITSHKNV